MSNEPIAIIGTACRFAGGVTSPSALWDLLESPRDVQTSIPESRFNTDGYYHQDGTFHGHTAVQHMYSLDQHPAAFDAQFFQIKPVEARAIDPQQRILLELVYEATEAAGLSIDKLKGTKTGVYVGQMCNDHEMLVNTDITTMPTYCATGTSRALASNRISYFFDWRGPSLTLDTACSSSLYCLHLAVQALRTGDATTAVVCGTNVLVSPNAFAAESNLNMLSPDGRSRMWDANANGYARGEGVAVLVLKPLRAALRDGDHIECVVRETGVNQDGATPGITVPDAQSQADLIRDTYQKAGLDLTVARDRPQFFEAHGTGTPTGDPIEAEAIQTTMRKGDAPPLYVGSIKTILGHTESTAGVAGVLKAMLALKHSVIPPNMLFTRLSAKVAPFSNGLVLPVTAQPWPAVLPGDPRRASVNSFGFGGSNAHCILESTESDTPQRDDPGQLFSPYVFSAGTERALASVLKSYSDWAGSSRGVCSDPRDLAWTLSSRRSVHAARAVFPAGSIAQLKDSIDAKLAKSTDGSPVGVLPLQRQPRILAVFSGQGAQSARMAAELIETSPLAQKTMHGLEQSLAQLPSEHRPTWSLTQELLAAESTSRLHLAELAQPLSTAVQILLVDMLRAAGAVFHGTIGHSSGEIGAAYAAGFLTAKDAIRIAYYRGLGSKFACSPNGKHIKGAMLAVGADMDDAEELLREPEFHGRACIAASNSSSSITLSGDEEAIAYLEDIYEDEKKFRRRLKVDMAYHSAHMQPCADHYVQWLRDCNIQAQEGSPDCYWQSTVYETRNMSQPDSLQALGAEYWADNLTNPVRFSQGLRMALETTAYDIVLEIGPHPTLKGPVMQTIKEAGQSAIMYHGTLQRKMNAVHALSTAIGFLWAYHESPDESIRLDDYEKAASGRDDHRLVTELPSYPWDHSRLHWHNPRSLRKLLGRTDRVHPLLGHADKDSSVHQMRWRHILRTKQIPWLGDHRLQGITVFPAAGYLSSLLEACQIALPLLRGQESTIGLFETTDFVVHRAMVFSDAVEESEEGGIEITVELLDIAYEEDNGEGQFTARFVYSAGVDKETGDLSLVASSNVLVHFGPQTSDMLLHIKPPVDRGLVPVDKSVFYESMAQIGYGYTGSFQGADKLRGSLGKSEAVLGWDTIEQQRESGLLVHPAVLDTAIQMLALAYSYPYDGRLWSLFVPVRIDCLRIHLDRFTSASENTDAGDAPLTMTTVTVNDGDDLALAGDADIYAGQYLAIQMQGGKLAPFANASEVDDVKMWASMRWGPMDISNIDLNGKDPVASALATLSHRYPRMSILELGSGNVDTMKNVLNRIGLDGLHLYTYTASSADVLNGVREQLDQQWTTNRQSRVSFRTLDPSNDASSQGFHASSFDSIIARLDLHAAGLEKTLRDLRVLLRPGGFLVVDVEHAVPICKQEDWNVVLKTCGFSQIDALALGDDNSVAVLVSQAVDDQINSLRHPLSRRESLAISDDVLLVGGAQDLVNELQAILAPHTRLSMSHIASVSSVDPLQLASAPIIISLTDLDKPIFKNISASEFDGVKAMLSREKTILWVTRNRRQGNPWANLTTAFLRTARRELPELRLQALDFEGPGEIDAAVVASCILSLLLSHHAAVPTPGVGPLLSMEPEIIVDESGRYLIPRFESMPEADQRYNSARRKVFGDTYPERTAVALNIDAKSQASFSTVPPKLVSELRGENIKLVSSYSTIRAIDTPVGPRHLSLGSEAGSQRRYVWLVDTPTSIQDLPRDDAILLSPEVASLEPGKLLSLLAAELWSAAILDRMQPGQRLLLHNPPQTIASTVLRNAASKEVHASITCADKKAARLKSWTYIEAHMPLRDLRKSLSPESISSCIIFGDGKSHEKVLLSCIPNHCHVRIINSVATPGHQSLSNMFANGILEPILSQAIDRAISQLGNNISWTEDVCALDMESLLNSQRLQSAGCLAIMQWPKGALSASLSRLDAGNKLFPSTKSYWLLGLTSGLGLGICDWMVAKGARNIVLSSRSGQVETSWLQKHLRNGVTIRVIPCDITSRSAVEQAYAEILSDTALPPLGGVMNGAALFRDRPIREMSLEELNASLRPKVDGSLHLDHVLGSSSLDFFVMFSSMIGVTGNVGQANYSSANAFMSALATDRRRRGLPGSAISIGAVIGAGYMAREFGDERINAFAEMSGVRACSEVDVHQFLAEAIFGGERNNHGVGDLSRESDIGLAMMGKNNAAFKPSWQTDPTFSRFHPDPDEDEQGGASQSKSGGTVKDRLQLSESTSDVVAVVSDEVLAKLRGLLQLDSSVDDGSLLRQKSSHMGIDSLVAVELRSWVVKTFQVSIPVLEILEGIATSDLIERIAQQIPEKMVPILHGGSPEIQTKPVPNDLPIKSTALRSTDATTKTVSTSPPPEVHTDLQKRSNEAPLSGELAKVEPAQVPAHSSSTPSVIRRVDFSFSQATFWFVHSLLKNKTVLNHTTLFRTSGKQIRVESLRAALRAVSGRHEVLRTCVIEHDGKFQQGVLEQSPLHLEVRHITRGMTEVQEVYRAVQSHVFDLASGDVMRIVLLTTDSPTESYFITSVHHIANDSFCMPIFLRDVEAAYNTAQHNSRRWDPSNVKQYGAFITAQQSQWKSGAWDADLAYWAEQFPTVPEPLPLRRAKINSRKPLEDYEVHNVDITLSQDLADRVRRAASAKGATAFHFYLAAFRVLLYRMLFQGECSFASTDICIGIADAHRTEEADWESMGPYMALLPLHFPRRQDPQHAGPVSFETVLEEARIQCFGALRHANPAFDVILDHLNVNRTAEQSPLFQAFVDYRQGWTRKQSLLGTTFEMLEFQPARVPYDLSLDVIDNVSSGEGATITLMGQTAVYDSGTVAAFARCYEDILQHAVDVPQFDVESDDWDFRHEDVRHALSLGSGADFQPTWPETLIHQFDLISARRLQKLAIVSADGSLSLSYLQLRDRVARIGKELCKAGIGPGDRVVVYQHATADQVSSMLAVMAAGAIHIPFDPTQHPGRLQTMLSDCQPSALLVDASTLSGALEFQAPSPVVVLDVSTLSTDGMLLQTLDVQASSAAAAMILYTSGTTGIPKGVVLSHASWAAKLEADGIFYNFDDQVVVLQQSACGFDMAILQVFAALAHGGTLCIIPQDVRGDSEAVSKAITEFGVSFTCGTPTEYRSWLRHGDKVDLQQSAWSVALSGGEAASPSLLQAFRELDKVGLRLFNGYGPTETTYCSSRRQLDYAGQLCEDVGLITAGPACPNESIYIVDERMHPLPIGLPGEIVIGGVGVSMGYYGDADRTQEAFLPDMFTPRPQRGSGMMYRTKDRGRLLPNGELSIEGRIGQDTLIKLRGVRIDLQDIEQTIIRCASGLIAEAVVSARTAAEDSEFLVAHVVFASNDCSGSATPLTTEDKKIYLANLLKELPLSRAMRPSCLIPIDRLPMTVSGKLDRLFAARLPAAVLPTAREKMQTLNEHEQALREMWTKLLFGPAVDDKEISPEIQLATDFFHIGGTSMLLMELKSRIRKELHVSLDLIQLFESSTLEAMARLVKEAKEKTTAEPINGEGTISDESEIDWEKEARLSQHLKDQLQRPAVSSATLSDMADRHVVLLTGAAGGLGAQLLRILLKDDRVAKVICIALRRIDERVASGILPDPATNSKVKYYPGDLRRQRLGLSQEDYTALSQDITCVLHVAAEVSHAKTYETLRPANVDAMAELVEMCIPRRAAMHMVSSAEIAMLGGDGHSGDVEQVTLTEASASSQGIIPSAYDGLREGYAASKWVAERLLENAHQTASTPGSVWIYRPTGIVPTSTGILAGGESDAEQDEALSGYYQSSEAGLLQSLLYYSRKLRAVPDVRGVLEGALNLVNMDDVAQDIVKSVLEAHEIAEPNIRYRNLAGDSDLEWDQLTTYLGGPSSTFETISLKEWGERAELAGMHPLLVQFFDTARREKRVFRFPKVLRS